MWTLSEIASKIPPLNLEKQRVELRVGYGEKKKKTLSALDHVVVSVSIIPARSVPDAFTISATVFICDQCVLRYSSAQRKSATLSFSMSLGNIRLGNLVLPLQKKSSVI